MVSKPQIRFKGPAYQRDFTSILIKIMEFNKRPGSAELAAGPD
jgi:hypothetical protein